jgi:transposase-like protein
MCANYLTNLLFCQPLFPDSLLQYSDKGRLPEVKQQIVDMTLNGSGVRDIVRVLRVSSATVIDVLKKKSQSSSR